VTEKSQFDPAEVVAAWAADPALFVRQALGAEPDDWQAEALRALAVENKIAVRSGHGVGKTTFLAWAVLWWLLTRFPAKIACTANTQHQLETILWGEIARWHRRLPDGLRQEIEVKSDKVVMTAAARGDSGAFARTASKERPEALQGFHSENMMFVVDEASGVYDIIFEVAEGSLSTAGAKVLLTGNPTRRSGYFYDAFFGKLSERWFKMRVSAAECRFADKGWVADMLTKYGENSPNYRVRVLGEFPEADADTVVPIEFAQSAIGREIVPTGPVVWGLDVARFGGDRSVLVKRQGGVVLEKPRVWRQLDLMQLCGAVVQEFKATRYELRPAEVLVDVIGLGAGVVDRLREMNAQGSFPPSVRGINVSEASSMSDRFLRLRDELWWGIRDWLGSREASLPNDEDLVNEICSPRYGYTGGTSRIKVESKDEMRRRGVESPDLADALMLTFASAGASMFHGSRWGGGRHAKANTRWVV